MSKRRIPDPQNSTHGPFQRFIGVSLSAGRAERTSLSVLEHYPASENRIFLSQLVDKIKTDDFQSADTKLLELITSFESHCQSVVFDAPLTLPVSLTSEGATEKDIWSAAEWSWLQEESVKRNQRRPRKNFTPYAERAVDVYLANEMAGVFEVHPAMSSNLAPLTARAVYLRRRISLPVLETSPKILVWRLGQELKLRKSYMKNHRSAVIGQSSRREFLRAVAMTLPLFIYEQDLRLLIDQPAAFDSFVCALMGFLHFKGLSEKPPEQFPKASSWVETPLKAGVLSHIDLK